MSRAAVAASKEVHGTRLEAVETFKDDRNKGSYINYVIAERGGEVPPNDNCNYVGGGYVDAHLCDNGTN